MPDLDRVVAGLRCRDVLQHLADFVDEELDADTLEQVTAHLRGCDTCEKFGEDYAALVTRLRMGQKAADPGLRARLAERMAREWDAGLSDDRVR